MSLRFCFNIVLITLGWGDQDDSQQQSFSDFGVSRKAPQTFGFGDSGGGEEDEIAGW